jgi:hypothetical protein
MQPYNYSNHLQSIWQFVHATSFLSITRSYLRYPPLAVGLPKSYQVRNLGSLKHFQIDLTEMAKALQQMPPPLYVYQFNVIKLYITRSR